MKIWKYSGTLLTATGIIHTIIACLLGWNSFKEMFNDGLINSVGNDIDRSLAVWFFICGIMIIFLGQTLQYYIKREQKPAPLSLGYSMLIFSVIGCFIVPISGFWLFLPQALIIVFARKQ